MVGNCIKTVFASYIAACTKLSGVMVQIGLKVATDSRVTACRGFARWNSAVWALGTVEIF